MLSAESAVLLDFHTIRMSLLILGRVIVAALAFRASQGDSCTHSLYLQMMNYTPVIGSSSEFHCLPVTALGFLGLSRIKKRPFFDLCRLE